LVVRFGDDVAKESPMQESLSSGSRVDALLRASEHDAALLRASELDNGEIFPAELGFDVIRRDREGDAHGGVLIASKSDYGLTQVNVSKEASRLRVGKCGFCFCFLRFCISVKVLSTYLMSCLLGGI
jgi:hypothetical protein